MEYFYTPNTEGVSRLEILGNFKYKGRRLVYHEGAGLGSIRVSDYETGLRICEELNKTAAIRKSKELITKGISNNYNFEKHPKINHPTALQMFDLIKDLSVDLRGIHSGNKDHVITFKITF